MATTPTGARTRAEHEGEAPVAAPVKATAEVETPKGTLTILLFYAALMVALWGYTYLTLLARR